MAASGEYLIRRGMQLIVAGQQDEAIEVLREAVTVSPRHRGAWLNLAMLLHRRGSAEAYPAFTQFLRVTYAGDPAVSLATEVLQDAGYEAPVPGPADPGNPETVEFTIESGGQRILIMAENDSGVEPEVLTAVLDEMLKAVTWLDAYLVYDMHPELLSSLVGTLLDAYASQDEDPLLAHQAQVNLATISRVREIGLLAAFAEGDQTPVDEFRHLVRAKREIEPVLSRLNGLTLDELWRRLDETSWVAHDDDTYLLLARLAETASDERRAITDLLRRILERHAQGKPGPDPKNDDHGPGQELASGLEEFANAQARETAGVGAAIQRGMSLLALDDQSLSAYWRVEITSIVAQCWFRASEATSDLEALGRAEDLLASVSGLVVLGSWQDATREMIFADIGIRAYEHTGDEAVLERTVRRLTDAHGRVGRYRSADAPLLRALASVRTLQAERTGDGALLREATDLLDAAERVSLREGAGWLTIQHAQIRVLLDLEKLGDRGALSRCDQIVADMVTRFGEVPYARVQVFEAAGRVASRHYRQTSDVTDLDAEIQACQKLLDFPEATFTNRIHPRSNLANALWHRYLHSGDLADLEAARHHGEAALASVSARSSSAPVIRRNLARIYTSLGGDENRRRAADLFRVDLNVLPAGPDRTVAALNYALAIFQMAADGKSVSREEMKHAYSVYVKGMTSLDPALMPWEAVDFGEAMAVPFIERERWEQASVALNSATAGIDALGIEGGEWPQETLDRLDQIVQLSAYCLARAGESEGAVLRLEGHQARALRRALQLNTSDLTRLAAAGREDLARNYATRAAELRSYGHDAVAGSQDFLERRRRILRGQLDVITKQIRTIAGFEKFGAKPSVEDLYHAAADSVLAYIAITPIGGLALLVDGMAHTTTTVDLPDIETGTVRARTDSYLKALDSYRATPSSGEAFGHWLAELDRVRNWLWTTLMTPLAKAVPGSQPVTIIPSGFLGLLPLTAAEAANVPHDRHSAIDIADWRHAPSADALLAARRAAARSERQTCLSVIDPQPTDFASLRWARVEQKAVSALGRDVTSLAGTEATSKAVLRAMPDHTMLHLACHGAAYIDAPLTSYLALAEHEKLTVGELTDKGKLWGTRLCFLSACDSGVAGTAMPQEVVSLPSALIQLGAAAVVATQWPVGDMVAAVFALRFYVSYSEGLSPSAAFAETQRWLRGATRTQVSVLLRKYASDVPELAELIEELPLEQNPFGKVQHWAAFTYTGC